MNNTPEERDEEAKAKQDERETLRRLSAVEVLQFIFNAVLAVTAIVGSVYIYRQTRAVERQLNVMEKQLTDAETSAKDADATTQRQLSIAESQAASMKTLADANKAMADAAKISADNSGRIAKSASESITSAQESSRLDQRAWVGVKGISQLRYVVGQTAGVTIQLINSGKTPAHDVFVDHEQDWIPVGHALPPPAPPHIRSVLSHQMLNPGQESLTLVYTVLPLTQTQFDAIRTREVIVYLRLWVTYRDQFGTAHKTSYCGVLHEDMNSLTFCDSGNASD